MLFVSIILIPNVAYGELNDTKSDVIKPVVLDFKFRNEPIICLIGTDDKAIQEGINSVSDWMEKLKTYSKHPQNWNMTVLESPQDLSNCNVEIHFLKKPTDENIKQLKNQGITIFQPSRAYVEIYTQQYYNDDAIKYVNDGSGKDRPVVGEYADVPIEYLGKVIKHEMGHVFGLEHQQSDSVMVTGYRVAHITKQDCSNVFKKYGENWK